MIGYIKINIVFIYKSIQNESPRPKQSIYHIPKYSYIK